LSVPSSSILTILLGKTEAIGIQWVEHGKKEEKERMANEKVEVRIDSGVL
jgi:hypothetical protein